MVAGHVREQHAGAFEHVALFDQAREPATARFALPFIAAEGLAVGRFEAGDDAGLDVEEVRAGSGEVEHVASLHHHSGLRRASIARWPMSRRIWHPSNRIWSATS